MKYPKTLAIDESPVYLRLIDEADADELYEVLAEDQQHLQVFQPFARNTTRESTDNRLKISLQELADGTRLQYRIVIGSEAGEPKIIGNLTFYGRDKKNKARLGYWITKPYEGKGYMFKAAQAFVDYGFNKWGLQKVELTIDANNERSQHLARKLGAQPTGKLGIEETDGVEAEVPLWEIVNE
jgi:ribosomal-protein-serine acetyltransferase